MESSRHFCTIASYKGLSRYLSRSEKWSRSNLAGRPGCIGNLDRGWSMHEAHNLHVRSDDETILDHRLDFIHGLVEFVLGIDHSNHDGQIMRDVQKPLLVRVTLDTVTEDTAVDGSS